MRFLSLLLLFIFSASAAAAREPSLREVQQAALERLGFEHERIDTWKRRARWAAALPRLEVGFQRDLKDVVSLRTEDNISISDGNVLIGPEENQFDQDFNQGTSFQVKAVWYLDEIVFHRNTLAASHERRDWIRERNRTLQEVSRAYFLRRRLAAELRRSKEPPAVVERKKILLDEALGTLNAFTEGWFSEQIEGAVP